MFDDKHYVPAIRWRQGEREALKELRPDQREHLTPLVDVPPIPWDFEEERPSRTIDRHLNEIPDQMIDAWGMEAPIFIDLGLVDETLRMTGGQHPVDYLLGRLSSNGIFAIPVTGTDRDPDYQNAIRSTVARDKRGVCIRATIDDLGSPTSVENLDDLRQDIGLPHDQVDLILDLRSIDPAQSIPFRTFIMSELARLPSVNIYRTLTLLTGAFPLNLSGIAPGITLLPRADWTLWLSVRSSASIRVPSYGDYTATHPDQEEIDPRLIQMSANIRYAADTDWVIAKGRSVRSPRFGGFGQYHALSQSIRAHAMFTGQNFSWASDYIEQCATGVRPGNAMIWRKVATNRHMARVVHQIASLP